MGQKKRTRATLQQELIDVTAARYAQAMVRYLAAERRLNRLMKSKPATFKTLDLDTGQEIRIPCSERQWRADIRIQASRVRRLMGETARVYSHLRMACRVGDRAEGWEEYVKPPVSQSGEAPYAPLTDSQDFAGLDPQDMEDWGRPNPLEDDRDDDDDREGRA